MAEQIETSNERFLKRYDTVFSFLGLELVALLFFGFGGATGSIILKVIGGFLAFMSFPFAEKALGKEGVKKAAITLSPLLVFFLLLGFSGFWFAYYKGGIFFGILLGILQFIGLAGLLALGIILKTIPSLKRETVVFGLLCGLAVYVVLTGVYSVARYGAFYASIFAEKYYYFDGVIFPIAAETKALYGFEFLETSLSFGKAPAFLLAASGAGMLFFKKEKKPWLYYLVFVGLPFIGLLDLALVPHKLGLLLLLGVYLIAGIGRGFYEWFHGKPKTAQILSRVAYFGLMFVAILGVSLLFIDAYSGILRNANIPFISRHLAADTSFFGSIRKTIQDVLFGSAANADIKKIDFASLLFGVSSLQSVTLTESFEFNLLYENGLLMFGLMFFLIFMAIRGLRSYLVEGGIDPIKGILVMMLLGAFVYFSVVADNFPFVHKTTFLPLSQTPLVCGLAFVFGYTFEPKHYCLKKGDAHEE